MDKEGAGAAFGFSRDNPPPFVDEDGNFVDADFVCDKCGTKINVQFHPRLLGNMAEVHKWLDENAWCACKPLIGP